MKIEVEIKLKLTPQIKKVLEPWLKIHATHKGTLSHIEYYLDNPDNSFKTTGPLGIIDARDFLRIRKTEKGSQVCLKRWYEIHCDEYEVEVRDPEVLLDLFKQIGYTDSTKIDKTRRVYEIKGFEIVIDNVKGIGEFAEIEIKQEVESPERGIELINDLLRSAGVKTYTMMQRGYVSMAWNKHFDFGKEITL